MSGGPPAVGVFCGAHRGSRMAYEKSAVDLARAIAATGARLVYGGAGVGLMKVVADECLASGVEIVGVIPDFLVDAEVAHRDLADLRVTASMAERKDVMMRVADVFVVLPGGLGTLDELFEVLTLNQLGVLAKPVGLLDPEGYYTELLRLLDRGHEDGFIGVDHERLLTVRSDASDLLGELGRRLSAR